MLKQNYLDLKIKDFKNPTRIGTVWNPFKLYIDLELGLKKLGLHSCYTNDILKYVYA